MADKTKDELNSNDTPTPKPVRDEVTKNKIDKHLSDINDTISEEDIQNIKTNITVAPKVYVENPTDDIKDKSDIEEPKKEMPNTWDMVDE